MKAHMNFTKNGVVEDLYFIDPVVVYDETISLQEALDKLETAQKNGQYGIFAVTYESHDDNQKEFLAAVYDKPVSRDEFLSSRENGDYVISKYEMAETQEEIENNIEKVRDYIRDGHTYQVNYTTRMHGEFSGDAHALYETLTKENNGGYTAYIEHDDLQIVSCSPELFFEIDRDRTIRTRPMKGTAPRGETDAEDEANYEFLRNSKKDRAENVMIVDLLRNDVSKVSAPGTVKAPKLFTIEKYNTVFQMTSTVEGKLLDIPFNEIFTSLYPCGSITGAPKLMTMKIIEELESTKRGYYCGAIGMFHDDETVVVNVPIRTIVIEGNEYTYAAGGGITYNSNKTSEYKEILAKSKFLEQAYV